MGNQISITNEGAFPSKFVSMMNAIKPFMDINLSETKDMESTFNEAVKYYKAGEADKESFYKVWKIKTKKEYELNKEAYMRKASSEWWNYEENYLDIDKPQE